MTKPLFTYGDRIRRKKGDCSIRTIVDITTGEYYFQDGTFALIADQDCYEIAEKASGFFKVAGNIAHAPVNDHLHHGYEDRQLFADALRKLVKQWGGRIGQNVAERNKFLLLRFYDTPGGMPDEAWLPLFLLTPAGKPDYMRDEPSSTEAIIAELDEAFGFD